MVGVGGDQFVMGPGTSEAGRRVVGGFVTARGVMVCLIQKDIWVNWIVES
jgi:hypothetical protein